ncbi:MAG: S-layer homology domain-containing protein [Candidatus Gracilibacteria bacterium]|nr:S-layer homology domain-containing protein [Candidatus Gracilibacteria bacterium]
MGKGETFSKLFFNLLFFMSNSLLKKVTAAVALTAIVSSTIGSVSSTYASSAELEAAAKLADAGVITTASDYRLGDTITRREMLKVMMNLSDSTVENKCEGKFTDLPATDWGCKYAEAALAAGYIAANSKFRPNDNVSKAEAIKMVMKAKGLEKDSTAGLSWEAAYVKAAVAAKLVDASFTDYTTAAKRGFTIESAANAMDSSSDDLGLGDLLDGTGTTVSTGTTNTDGTTTVVKSGDLEVSLNPASPSNGSSIPYAGIVKFAAVDLTAGGSDVSVNSVEVKKAGLSTVSTSTKVWFEKNGKRVSARTSFTSEGNAVITFAPAYVIKAGTTETLDLIVELADNQGGTDYTFVSGEFNTSSANFSGSFSTNTLRTSNYSVTKFKLEKASTDSSYNVNGNEIYELGAFKITTDKPSSISETRDLNFKTITLYQSGSANLTNLDGIYLERNGTKVSSDITVDGKTITIQLNDTIKDGATATYYVKAKVAYVEKTQDTYQFYTKNTSDLVVDEISSGIRSSASTGYATLVSNLYKVNGSDLSFTKDDSVSLSATYAPGTSNVVLLQGYIDSKQAVNLENPWLNYDVTGLTSTSALSDYFSTAYMTIGNSSLSASVSTSTGVTTGTLKFSGTVTVNGKVPVKIYANLKSGSNLADLTLKLADFKLESFGNDGGRNEYVSNQEVVSNSVGSITSVSLTVGTSTLSSTRTDGLGDTTIASGLKGVTVFGSKFTSTQGNPVRVTSLTFNFTGSTSFVNNAYATLYVDGNAVKSKTINQEAIKFDGFNFDVSTSKSTNVLVKVDFSDAFASGAFKATLASGTATDTVSSTTLDSKITALAGANFTIANAGATLAASNDTPKRLLVTAGQTAVKLLTFRLTAKNDKVNLKKVVFNGSKLDSFTSYSLRDASGKIVSSVNADDASVSFDNISADTFVVNQDATSDLYLYADAKTNTNTGLTNIALNSMTIRSSNGKELYSAASADSTHFAYTANSVTSNGADVYENTAKIAQVSPVSKNISTDAMRFSVTAAGKNKVTLNTLSLSGNLANYAQGNYTLKVKKVSNNDTVASTGVTVNASGSLVLSETITFSNATVDAGTTETYYVEIENLITSDSSKADWSISLKSLVVGANDTASSTFDLANYPSNVDTLPLNSSK